MTHPRNFVPATPAEKEAVARRLAASEQFKAPREVWVEDGHVFIEWQDAKTVSMTPEIAIDLGRRLSEAGTDSLINKVMEKSAEG